MVQAAQAASNHQVDPALAALMIQGVAFHHAGLTTYDRGAVERAFREGLVRLLVCTTTLAAGVNLPARRVIVRSLNQGGGELSAANYRQMAGRAGRKGQSSSGEAVRALLGVRAQWFNPRKPPLDFALLKCRVVWL